MLQQTQVATVIPYYERFLRRFSTVSALARASQQQVLRHWEGLGYYRRARQLHAAARQIEQEYGGKFPTTIERVRELPGIGRYTAGAILSIALDQRHPILEANTIRVLSRLLAYTGDPGSRDGQRYLWALAENVLPRRRVGDFNQALMELGSLICTPRHPACGKCPVARICPTNELGLQEEIPRPKQKAEYVPRREAAVVVQAAGKILLRRCGKGERWEGLWDFPRFPLSPARGKKLERELVEGVASLTGLHVSLQRPLATIRHGVTRYRITLHCHLATCALPGRTKQQQRWVTVMQATNYPLSVTGRQICQLLEDRQ
jgi:A/G-specific adenine glycosylase